MQSRRQYRELKLDANLQTLIFYRYFHNFYQFNANFPYYIRFCCIWFYQKHTYLFKLPSRKILINNLNWCFIWYFGNYSKIVFLIEDLTDVKLVPNYRALFWDKCFWLFVAKAHFIFLLKCIFLFRLNMKLRKKLIEFLY